MKDKLYRTLVRVTGIQDDGVWLCVPGWNSAVSVLRPYSVILSNTYGVFAIGQRFFAKVNLGADEPDELLFSDFEYDEQDEHKQTQQDVMKGI